MLTLFSLIIYYNNYCVVLQDNKNKDEIVIFRPSSMPITEVIDDEKEFDEAKPTYWMMY